MNDNTSIKSVDALLGYLARGYIVAANMKYGYANIACRCVAEMYEFPLQTTVRITAVRTALKRGLIAEVPLKEWEIEPRERADWQLTKYTICDAGVARWAA